MDETEPGKLSEDDVLDLILAYARVLTTGPHRYSLDEVLAHFGYTREQLREMPDVDAVSRRSD
jgi:hypothetical protein